MEAKLSNEKKIQHLKSNGKMIGKELHLPEGLGFEKKNITNERLTVMCSQLNIKNADVVSYHTRHERLTSDINHKVRVMSNYDINDLPARTARR